MKKFLQEKWKTKDIEFGIFLLFLLGMAVYYGWRLFVLTPWYDELYTYYYFVSRGPIYAAIHWPLPNNHMGYSVLSGVLDYFRNSAIGLRGVSWICNWKEMFSERICNGSCIFVLRNGPGKSTGCAGTWLCADDLSLLGCLLRTDTDYCRREKRKKTLYYIWMFTYLVSIYHSK